MIKNIKWVLLASFAFVACDKDLEEEVVADVPVTAGEANFSKYVALGDSYAAGYSDGALFNVAQMNSYPSILANQFKSVGGGAFNVPFMENPSGLVTNIGGFSDGVKQVSEFDNRLVFKGMKQNNTPKIEVLGAVSPVKMTDRAVGSSFSNFGIPGAKSFHLLAVGYGSLAGLAQNPPQANPYFVRMSTAPSTTVLADALMQQPSFYSLWIGGNDVLGYALSGGDGSDPLTPVSTFKASYDFLLQKLSENGRKGVVANLAYVNALPNFNLINVNPVNPYNYFEDGDEDNLKPVISAADLGLIRKLNSELLGPLKIVLGDRISLLSESKANPVLIYDETLSDLSAQIKDFAVKSGNPTFVDLSDYLASTFGKVRHSREGDLFPLKTKDVIGKKNLILPAGILQNNLGFYGVSYPLEDKHVLIPSELAEIKLATDQYNIVIKEASDKYNTAFFNAKEVMAQLANGGVRFGNYDLNSSYFVGGAFSLDGVHPSARGYALIANKFIEAINAKYKSTIKPVDLGAYRMQYPANL